MKSIEIDGRAVGPGHRPLVIAEVAQAHDGSLNMAHAFIDAIADAGADAVKFQTHIAAAESTIHEPWRIRFSRQDETRYAYWKRMEFTPAQWAGLKEHAEQRGLLFVSSAFSPEAVDLLIRLGIRVWKVASGEVASTALVRQMAATRLPVLLSSGMSRMEELDRAVAICRDAGCGVGVFQCTTMYPCPPEKVGLNVLAELQARFGCPVGLSDHSGRVFAGLAAVTLGASMIELHVTFSRQMFGPDVLSSVTFPELAQLTEGVRAIHTMLSTPVEKDVTALEMDPMRRTFQKVLVTARPLASGSRLAVEDFVAKKAGRGISPELVQRIAGRVLVRDVAADHPISEADLNAESSPI